ncbi:uncharacterized protein N7458_001931 [Penicillium daleae]|uniref:Uncharacterized protein n=1 Tax=Penicillium daleae TaxID=63821 RepID=A0AAD6CBZ5_9EURO|nr:uncharacterized protein N7458_001931 [Penicillium daleae]KAJ5460379.1 hypothetical protein N7458_001931 [Penicillium daleae]
MASFVYSSSSLPPKTPKEWEVVLMEVKRLYLDRQYKQCAARATKLLATTGKTDVSVRCLEVFPKAWQLIILMQVHPIYIAYLAFHAAISYEFLGQAAHLYSSNKVNYLQAALDSFLECLRSIPESFPLPKLATVYPTPPPSPQSVSQTQSPLTSYDYSATSDEAQECSPLQPLVVDALTRMIDVSLNIPDVEDPFVSDSETEGQDFFMRACIASVDARGGSLQNNALFRVQLPQVTDTNELEEFIKMNSLMPSPLRVRKSVCELPPPVRRYPGMFDTPTKLGKSVRARRPLQPIPEIRLNLGHIKLTAAQVAKGLAARSSPSRIPRTPTKNGPKGDEREGNENKGNGHKGEEKTVQNKATTPMLQPGVDFLRSQVNANISDVRRHVEKVAEIQRVRRARKIRRAASFWSFSPVTQAEGGKVDLEPELIMDELGNVLAKESKEQRIARLRADGWTTVGMRSPRSTWKGAGYYQELCNVVLTEMCVDN